MKKEVIQKCVNEIIKNLYVDEIRDTKFLKQDLWKEK